MLDSDGGSVVVGTAFTASGFGRIRITCSGLSFDPGLFSVRRSRISFELRTTAALACDDLNQISPKLLLVSVSGVNSVLRKFSELYPDIDVDWTGFPDNPGLADGRSFSAKKI